jgi:O-antigen/teichoic acid export membrane protein
VGSRLISLVLAGIVTRYTGSTGLGRYVVITTALAMGTAFTDLGLGTLLTRDTAAAPSPQDEWKLLGLLFPLRMALAGLGAALLLILSALPAPHGASDRVAAASAAAGLAGVALVPRAGLQFLSAFLNGRRRFDVSSTVSVASRLLALAAGTLALVRGHGIAGVIVTSAAADAVGIVAYAGILRLWRALPRLGLSPARWKETLSKAYPFALTGVISVAYRRLDVLLLSAWRGDAAAGQYGAAYKLAETVGLIPASLLDALFPEMAGLAGQPSGRHRLRRTARRAAPLLFLGGAALSAVGTILAAPLVRLVYGLRGAPGGTVATFRIQLWAVPAIFLYLLNGHILYVLGRQRVVTAAMAIVAAVNVALNVLIIPRWGALGVSGVSLISAFLLWLLLASQARRALRRVEEAA